MNADDILHLLNLSLGTARKSDVRKAYRLANDEGTIQAIDMATLLGPEHPTRHTTCSVRTALLWLGCEEA